LAVVEQGMPFVLAVVGGSLPVLAVGGSLLSLHMAVVPNEQTTSY